MTKNTNSVFIVTPTYNEAENLADFVAELFAQPIANLHVIVVDDNSPDGTGQIADVQSRLYRSRMHVVHRSGKLGLGSAYREGFQYALERGADFVVQMDADGSHSPKYIPQFLEHAGRYDVVVGSRYMQGSQLDPGWSRWRYGLSLWANSVYVRLLLGLNVRDATAGFKLWSQAALSAILTYPVQSSGFVFQVEMAYLAQRLGLRVLEAPIYFGDRRHGQSKMSMAIKLEAAWRTLWLRWQYRHVPSLPPVQQEPSAWLEPRAIPVQVEQDYRPRRER